MLPVFSCILSQLYYVRLGSKHVFNYFVKINRSQHSSNVIFFGSDVGMYATCDRRREYGRAEIGQFVTHRDVEELHNVPTSSLCCDVGVTTLSGHQSYSRYKKSSVC